MTISNDNSSPAPSKPRTLRLVEVPWTCKRTGDCCRAMEVVTMTVEEADLLAARNTQPEHQRPLAWAPHSAGFVALQARPCPFLGEDAQCTVYDIRPYNCRRFMCGRVDVQTEPLENGGPIGCWNLSDRLMQSERFLHHYETTQRKAMPWALEHGWKRS